jgi:hypothetical protein
MGSVRATTEQAHDCMIQRAEDDLATGCRILVISEVPELLSTY